MFEAFGAVVGTLIVFIPVVGAGVYFFLKAYNSNVTTPNTHYNQMSSQQVQVLVVGEIKKVGKLVAVEKKFKSSILLNHKKIIPILNVEIPGTARNFFMDYAGIIACGCDLTEVHISHPDSLSDRVKIVLPHSKILYASSDEKSYKIHINDTGVFSASISLEEQNKWVADDIEIQKKLAIQEGILNETDERVRNFVTNIAERKGLKAEVVFLNKNSSSSLEQTFNRRYLQ